MSKLSKALKELYEIGNLSEAEEKLYYLICRYDRQKKVSLRLRYKKWRLRRKAKKAGSKWMKDLVYANNPFLALIPKEDDFAGKYITLPIEYDDEF